MYQLTRMLHACGCEDKHLRVLKPCSGYVAHGAWGCTHPNGTARTIIETHTKLKADCPIHQAFDAAEQHVLQLQAQRAKPLSTDAIHDAFVGTLEQRGRLKQINDILKADTEDGARWMDVQAELAMRLRLLCFCLRAPKSERMVEATRQEGVRRRDPQLGEEATCVDLEAMRMLDDRKRRMSWLDDVAGRVGIELHRTL
jgi:hypothetical protein